MPVVLTDNDKGKEFFIDLGDGTGAEGVYVIPMTDSEKDKLRQRFIKKKLTRYGRDDDFDASAFLHARLKLTIRDWTGFVDQDGKPIPCTPENIVALSEMNSFLFTDILDKVDRLAETGKEAAEKN